MNKLNIEQIKQILPHRYPFLLIDKVEDYVTGEWAHAIKCVTANEQFFEGHFPGQAVMPGVLILEALAQTGAIALLSEPGMAGRIALFGGAKNVRFKRQVVPGDVLHLECKLTKRWGPIGQGEAKATVDGKLACQAEISFMLPDAAATPALSSAPSVSASSDVASAQDASTNTRASANTDHAVAHTAPAQDASTNTNANDNSKDA